MPESPGEAAQAVPYTVRNTFIDDVAPCDAPKTPDLGDGTFCTWPLSGSPAKAPAANADLEDGELSDEDGEVVEQPALDSESPSSIPTCGLHADGRAPSVFNSAHAGPSPVPYTVRNTFIDCGTARSAEASAFALDSTFCTWPLPSNPILEAEEREWEDGEVPEWTPGHSSLPPPPGMMAPPPGMTVFSMPVSAQAEAAAESAAGEPSAHIPSASRDSPMKVGAVGYTVRNTFIDDVDQSPMNHGEMAAFCTWPLRGAPLLDSEGKPVDGLVAQHHPAPIPETVQDVRSGLQAQADLEDGELLEDGADDRTSGEDAEDGEVFDFGSLASTSVGSALHDSGGCKPCAWMYKDKEAGCRNGESCNYCHMCPPGEVKRRKRDKLLQRLARSSPKKPAALQGSPPPGMQAAGSAQAPVLLPPPGILSYVAPRGPGGEMEPCYVEVPGLTAGQPRLSGPLVSVGSASHGDGSCRPCAWMYKDSGGGGCKNGQSCSYCHLCPPGELKRRKREKFKAQNADLMEKLVQQNMLADKKPLPASDKA